MDAKRKALESAVVPVKRPRQDVVAVKGKGGAVVSAGPPRTSSLTAPIMLLTGHEGEIFASKFSPDGSFIASSGFDRQIFLWNVYGDCENFAVLSGAGGAVLDLQFFPDGLSCVTAATDKNLAVWDLETGVRRKRLRGHTAIVNCCQTARRGVKMVCSGADDGTVKLWDTRKRGEAHTFQNVYQVTSVAFSDTAEQIFSAGIDNDIKVWDMRKNDVLFRMRGHVDTVTGLALSPDGSYLLSNSMDNTVRIYDVRPYVPSERCVKIFQGAQHNFEKNLLRCAWSPDGTKVSAGSADRLVNVWDTTSRRTLYKLPGHAGSVNDVSFHPTEPIIMSAGSDKNIYLGEIEA